MSSKPSGAIAALSGLVAIASFAAMHVLMADTVDPVAQPVSSYALSWPGTALFGLGTGSLALACAALAAGGPEPTRHRWVRGLLALTAAMLLLVVVFRTDTAATVASVGGQIHRYAAGAAFLLLIAVGAAVSRLLPAGPGRRWAGALTAVSVLTMAVTTVNTFLPEVADGGHWRGIPQRVLLAAHAALIIALAVLPRRATAAVEASS